MGWLRVVLRGSAIAVTLLIGLIFFFLLRLLERPLHGQVRPWTPYIVQAVSAVACAILGLRRRCEGQPMQGSGAVVANHASWLDIFVLNASLRVSFVSKAEVARWPGIGFLAKVAGTLFISRSARDAERQRRQMADALRLGRLPLFFPEGTSTDGRQVLAFKSTLFGAIFNKDVLPEMRVQPVSVMYAAPPGADPRFYGWWGEMDFGSHALKLLAQAPQGFVTVICHPSLRAAEFANRKALAQACETAVRDGCQRVLQDRGDE